MNLYRKPLIACLICFFITSFCIFQTIKIERKIQQTNDHLLTLYREVETVTQVLKNVTESQITTQKLLIQQQGEGPK